MLDLPKWCQRAVSFTESLRGLPGTSGVHIEIGSPYTRDQISDFSAGCPLTIPDVLMNWYLSIGWCHCTYFVDISAESLDEFKLAFPDQLRRTLWGGADLIDLPDAVAIPNDFCEIAAVFQEDGFSHDARLWANSFPLIRETNADFIGLYVGDSPVEPSVAYLCHELCGASQIISPSFEHFLHTWEELSYIGVNSLQSFINPATGLLDSNYRQKAVQALRRIFQWVSRTRP